jgi:hypothetical protein
MNGIQRPLQPPLSFLKIIYHSEGSPTMNHMVKVGWALFRHR